MTREQAIKELTELLPEEFLMEYSEAIKMAVEALQQEPCEDCISRQQAIDKMQELEEEDIKAYGCSIPEGFDGKRAIEALKALSSVHPQPKIGKWIYNKEEDSYRCSLCTFPCHKDNLGAIPTKYCAGCGAKMQDAVKRIEGVPRENYEPLYNCENWIP